MTLTDKKTVSKKAWDDFFKHDQIPEMPGREFILESWIRCKQLGVPFDYTEDEIPCLSLEDLNKEIQKKQVIIDIVSPYLIKLFNIVKESGCIVALTDENGIILKSFCDDDVLKNFPTRSAIPGRNFSERMAGTNAIGTAIYLNQSVQIRGAEHYNIQSHRWVCSGSPLHNPQGDIIGCILISYLAEKANIFSLGMVSSAVDTIEKQLEVDFYFQKETEKNLKLQSALNHISEGVLIVNASKVIVYINDYCKQMMGLKNAEIIGKHINRIFEENAEINSLFQLNHNINSIKTIIKTSEMSIECTCSMVDYFNEHNQKQGNIIYFSPTSYTSKMIKQRNAFKAYYTFEQIVGAAQSIEKAKQNAKIAANSDSSVLLLGESGTGKELFAQAIHNLSARRNGPFIAVNCGAISKSLIESDLFGYAGGAFTGAKKEGQPGKFELADGGTIFLDEIGDMPLDMQVSLLRVLQEKEFVRVGGKNTVKVDVRVIAATNKDMQLAIDNQEFRIDLYYRLNVFRIKIPALRERNEDIPLLVNFFISQYSSKLHKNIYGIDDEAVSLLKKYQWPGNIRQLENTIERAVNFNNNDYISCEDLDLDFDELKDSQKAFSQEKTEQKNKQEHSDTIQSWTPSKNKIQIIELLKKHEGKVTKVAEELGIARKSVYARIKKYDIDVNQYREF